MEARSTPPPPERGPGREVVRERAWDGEDPEWAQLPERLAAARRWAYFATLLAALAAAAAAVAIAWALEEQGSGRGGASRSTVRALQEDVERLESQVSSARATGQDAESEAESLSARVEDLEREVSNAQSPDEGTQQELDRLSEDIDQLQQEVAQAARDGGSGSSP